MVRISRYCSKSGRKCRVETSVWYCMYANLVIRVYRYWDKFQNVRYWNGHTTYPFENWTPILWLDETSIQVFNIQIDTVFDIKFAPCFPDVFQYCTSTQISQSILKTLKNKFSKNLGPIQLIWRFSTTFVTTELSPNPKMFSKNCPQIWTFLFVNLALKQDSQFSVEGFVPKKLIQRGSHCTLVRMRTIRCYSVWHFQKF